MFDDRTKVDEKDRDYVKVGLQSHDAGPDFDKVKSKVSPECLKPNLKI